MTREQWESLKFGDVIEYDTAGYKFPGRWWVFLCRGDTWGPNAMVVRDPSGDRKIGYRSVINDIADHWKLVRSND